MKTIIACLATVITSIAFTSPTSTPEGWMDDFQAALKKAAKENKHIVANFSGSDWCGWCKRLDKEVFATSEFVQEATKQFVLLMIDTPRDKSRLTEKARKENPDLVKKFEIRGFPTVVVLDPKGKEVCRLGYQQGGPEKYLKRLLSEVSCGPELKKFIEPIEKILSQHDKEFKNELNKILREAMKKAEKTPLALANSEALQEDVRREAMALVIKKIYPKYIKLFEKALAKAERMKAPDSVKERKDSMIEAQRQKIDYMKRAVETFLAEKNSSKGKSKRTR
jgi:protein disulfide-isomerase